MKSLFIQKMKLEYGTMSDLNILAFKKNEIVELINTFSLEIDPKKRILKEGKSLECHTCGTKLTTKNLGQVTSGSPPLFFCDNPSCMIAHLRSK